MGETPLSVNKVDGQGRVYVPQEIRDRYIGDELAMYEPEPGKIVLYRVELDPE